MMSNTTIDWTQPLEAVNCETGEVVPVSRAAGYGDFLIKPHLAGGWWAFNENGRHDVDSCPWTIRNAATPAAIAPEAPHSPATPPLSLSTGVDHLERMEALVRRMAAAVEGKERRLLIPDYVEAVDIVSELPPLPDPDLVKAREIAADACETMGHHWAQSIRDGEKDEEPRAGVSIALAGIKAGREMGR